MYDEDGKARKRLMHDIDQFEDLVALRYQVYNSLFLTLPFSSLGIHGVELPLFAQSCQEGLENGESPQQLVEEFLRHHKNGDPEERLEVLFLFLQLVERQVLLYDAVEQAAFPKWIDHRSDLLLERLKRELPKGRGLRVVLTAHPTQFYPEFLLGLIQDLTQAVKGDNIAHIRKLLLQLARTSFRNPHPPTPLEEAEMLIDRFGQVFYEVFTDLMMEWEGETGAPRLELGFWPGGDRDGNPYVTVETTRQACERLRAFTQKSLLAQIEQLRKRITFKGLTKELSRIRGVLSTDGYASPDELREDLLKLLERVDKDHQGLFREEIVRVLMSLNLFGFHFASLDLRQSSEAIGQALESLIPGYLALSEDDKLARLSGTSPPHPNEEDLIQVLQLVPEVQKRNGPLGLHRFVVSHTASVRHLLEIFTLSGWYAGGALDIVPLFESIEDMRHAPRIMETLLDHGPYRDHLARRGERQTVMLGFSDGTKDGGYAACNWEIHMCKQRLDALARDNGVELIFFDGRGGPPARGGGSTHKYYAAVQERIPLKEIQQTVQGQSISSHYGTPSSARHNLLQLLAAFTVRPGDRPDDTLLEEIAKTSWEHYQALRSHDQFIPLLMEGTPLPLLGELNVASRPPKRLDGKAPSLENLRAISFVSAWSLMKLNVPAYYGFGFALEKLFESGREEELYHLYDESMFFRVLVGNASQALRKTYLPLTAYTEEDPQFGVLWKVLRLETERTRHCLMRLMKKEVLHMDDPVAERSVALREQMVLPLLVIQQYALVKWREDRENPRWKKLLLKSIPPSINASRNSA